MIQRKTTLSHRTGAEASPDMTLKNMAEISIDYTIQKESLRPLSSVSGNWNSL
jgi:hypothetical protein